MRASFEPRRSVLLTLAMLLVAAVTVAELTERWIVVLPEAGGFGGMALATDGSVFWVGAQGAAQWLQRYTSAGNRQYSERVEGGAVAAIAAMPGDTGVILAGSVLRLGGEVPWVARYRADRGTRVWEMGLDRYPRGAVRAVIVSAVGDVYVTGHQTRFGVPGDRRVFVAKLSAAGDLVWQTEFDHDAWDEGWAIALDPKRGDVYVGGRTGNFDFAPYIQGLLLRVSDADGTVVWSQITGGDEGLDTITALAISRNGKKIFTTGFTDLAAGTIERRDWFFQQYAAKAGAPRARVLYDLTGAGPDNPAAMVLSANGKTVYLAGEGCPGAASRCDAYLLTLAKSGALLDTTAYVFDPADDTFSSAVGLGPDGDPVWGGATLATGRIWIRKMAN